MNWWLKLRRRRRLDKDLDDEIAFHRDMRARDSGAPPFGHATAIRETTRELWRLGWIETAWQDARYALRGLRRQPGFTFVVVMTLALGIGANTAVFSVVNGVVLRPLGYPNPERLEFVTTQFPGLGFDRFSMSMPEFLEFREHTSAFESMGAYATGTVTLGTREPTRQAAGGVTPDLLPALGVRPALGRWFDAADSRPGADPVILLSWDLWQREFGADGAIVGQRVDFNGRSSLVVGVMPRGFDIHDRKLMLLVPLTIDPAQLPHTRSDHFLNVIARTTPGITRAQIDADIARMIARWREIVPSGHVPADPSHRIASVPLVDDVVGEVRGTLWTLQAAVGVVLLIACANLANLLIARADTRTHEHALRTALGASRLRIFGQLITEGVVLAAIAAAIGTLMGQVGLSLLLASYPDVLPRISDIALDWRVLAFAVGVTLCVSLVFGLAPFAHLGRDRMGGALGFATSRVTGGRVRGRLRTTLIIAEVALAVLLVSGAGLLLRSFVNLTKVDVGFDRSGLSTFSVSVPGTRYDTDARARFFADLVAAIRAIPGVERAAAMSDLPTQQSLSASDTDFAHIAAGRPPDSGPAENVDYFQTVSLEYLETMGVRVTAGRGFEAADVGGAPVALVNETLARKFFADRPALGQQLRRGFDTNVPWFTVVGVVEDVRQDGVATDVGTEIYILADQALRVRNEAPGTMFIAVRSSQPLSALAPQFRRVLSSLDPSLPLIGLRAIDDAIGASIARPRFVLLLLGLMAGLALLLAGVGIYGILAYLVAARRREIGVRMALGARPRDVVRLVLVRGVGAALAGLLCGLLASLGASRLLTSLLFDVTPADPLTLAGVSGVILLVSVAACSVPAWRASRVDPAKAVR